MKKRFIIIALSLLSLNAHAQKYNYDVNNDGQVTVSDIMLIVNKILGKENDEPKYPITVSVTQRPYADSEADKSGMLKSPVTNTESLANDVGVFYVDYSYYNTHQECYKIGNPELKTYRVADSGTWKVGTVDDSGEGAWPTYVDHYNYKIPFYAYANYGIGHFVFDGFVNDSDDPSVVNKPNLHFQVEESSSDQKDLLVAMTKDTYFHADDPDGKRNGHLFFTFDHACAAVQFFLSKTQALANSTITVKGVKLHNVYNDGYYYFNGNGGDGNQEWAGLGYKNGTTSSTYTLADNSTEILVKENYAVNQLSTEQDKENKYFFMIPQITTPWYVKGTTEPIPSIANATGAYIELENCDIIYRVDNDGQITQKYYSGSAYIPFGVTWEKGKKHKVNIQIGTGLRDSDGNRIFDTNGVLIKTTTAQ